MKKCVGQVRLHGKRLSYYVIGDRNTGYGVRITETCMEKADQLVSGNFAEALNLAHQLRRGVVFPSNLTEIIDDYRIDDNEFN